MEACNVENTNITIKDDIDNPIAAGIGGVVGCAENSTITNSTATGTIRTTGTGNVGIGGFIGKVDPGIMITLSSADVNITGIKSVTKIGGFAGESPIPDDPSYATAKISQCSAQGTLKDALYMGGFIGAFDKKVQIEDCYTTASCLNATYSGGFFGAGSASSSTTSDTVIKNSYADNSNATLTYAFGGTTVGNVIRANVINSYMIGDSSSITNADGTTVKAISKDASKTKDFLDTLNEGRNIWFPNPNGAPILKEKLADYTKVDAEIAKIPKDLSLYTNETVANLNNAKNSVIRNLKSSQQNIVDGYVISIQNAITQLTYKNADYTKLDEAISKIPSNLSIYTEETVKKLEEARNAVVRDKKITEQAVVDGYAVAIENAIAGLIEKPIEKSPQTGDIDVLTYVGMLIIGIVAMSVCTKKIIFEKKHNK